MLPTAAAAGAAAPDLYRAACAGDLAVARVGAVSSPLLVEISGAVASRRYTDVLWVHNDSGDSPRIYALGLGGRLRRTVEVSGADARDWEDIAIGPGPRPGVSYLYVADIGDNEAQRSEVTIYRFPEPALDRSSVRASRITLRYRDGAHDAEAFLVDPVRGDLLVVTKRRGPAGVYRARPGSSSLMRVATAPGRAAVTAATVSPDGRVVALRTYGGIGVWPRAPGKPLWTSFGGRRCSTPAPREPQGEAVAFSRDGGALFTISEGDRPPLFAIRALGWHALQPGAGDQAIDTTQRVGADRRRRCHRARGGEDGPVENVEVGHVVRLAPPIDD